MFIICMKSPCVVQIFSVFATVESLAFLFSSFAVAPPARHVCYAALGLALAASLYPRTSAKSMSFVNI